MFNFRLDLLSASFVRTTPVPVKYQSRAAVCLLRSAKHVNSVFVAAGISAGVAKQITVRRPIRVEVYADTQ